MESRAENAAENPAYKEVLDFFRPVLALKEAYTRALRSSLPPPLAPGAELVAARARNGVPILDKPALAVDYAPMKRYFLNLLILIADRVPQAAEEIQALIDRDHTFETLIQNTLQGREPEGRHAQTLRFLMEETINPLLAAHAAHLAENPALKGWSFGYCPVCGGKPLLGMLCGEEGKKFLVCGACHTRWQFTRLQCAHCGTQDARQLSLLMTEGDNRYSIEVCDHCKTYLKIINCRQTHQNVDLDLENLTTLHLDIIARGKGYTNTNLYMMNA
jgi:FdhE protein